MGAVLLCGCKKAQVRPPVPDVFRVKFETTQGDFTVEATKAWAPAGVDRFHELVWIRYFDQGRFFRVLPGFIAQFGVHKDFKVHDVWRVNFIPDDPRRQENKRGTLAFAKSGPATRATEIFINLADNAVLDEQGFVPFARVVDGTDVPGKFYSGYGELGPEGKGPDAGRIEVEANEYLAPRFPKLDYIKQATFVP
jgi:peptidyl-prolyl cis-trans isomerase A (cyclophilin A)